MLEYVNKSEYIELLGAVSIPDNFNNLVREASSYINTQTFGRIDINNIPEAVKYATCLIINLVSKSEELKEEMGNLKSQNIEGWSETYMTPAEIDLNLEKDKINVLKNYLSNIVGNDENYLLYRG